MLKSTFRVWTLQEAENEGMSGFLGDDDGTPYTPAAEVIYRKSLEHLSCSSTGADAQEKSPAGRESDRSCLAKNVNERS